MKFLIDECLHTSLVAVAHNAGYICEHVNFLGLGGYKDWQLMAKIRTEEYTFVTNNRMHFTALYGQAPMKIGWLAIEKVVAGMIQALASGLVIIPSAWLLLGRGLELRFPNPLTFAILVLLVALFSAAGGLVLGCSIPQTQISLMFSLVIAPMIFFGCAYYPWSTLSSFPILQKLVLLNPLVYASEGFRGTLVPQFPHISVGVVLGALLVFDVLLTVLGLRQFYRKVVS